MKDRSQPLSALDEVAAAAAAERDATPFVARHIIGPVVVDHDATTAGRWQVVVETGPRRVGDGPLERPLLVDLVGRRSIRPDAVVSWEGNELRLEGTTELPAELAEPAATPSTTAVGSASHPETAQHQTAQAALPTGRTWYLVTEGGPPQLPTAQAEALARLAAARNSTGSTNSARPGPALVALLTDPAVTGGDPALPLVPDPGTQPAAAAVAAARVRAASPAGVRVLVVAEIRRADAVAVALDDLLGRPEAGRVLRVGVTTTRALAAHPRLSLPAAQAALPAASAGLAGSAARQRARDLAAAVLAEAQAIRMAAEAGADSAAADHRAATEALEELRASREAFRRLEELVVRVERMEAELAVWCSQTAVHLVGVGDGPAAQPGGPATAGPHPTTETILGRLADRAALLQQLAAEQREARRLGVSRRRVQQAEQTAHRARLGHLEADATVHRARAAEAGAAAELASRRSALDPSRDPDAVGEEAAASATAAIRRAAVVVSTPEEVSANPFLASVDFDEVIVDRAGSLPVVTLCLLALRCRGPMTLTVQDPAAPGSSRPPQPACADPRHRRWLAGPGLRAVGRHPG